MKTTITLAQEFKENALNAPEGAIRFTLKEIERGIASQNEALLQAIIEILSYDVLPKATAEEMVQVVEGLLKHADKEHHQDGGSIYYRPYAIALYRHTYKDNLSQCEHLFPQLCDAIANNFEGHPIQINCLFSIGRGMIQCPQHAVKCIDTILKVSQACLDKHQDYKIAPRIQQCVDSGAQYLTSDHMEKIRNLGQRLCPDGIFQSGRSADLAGGQRAWINAAVKRPDLVSEKQYAELFTFLADPHAPVNSITLNFSGAHSKEDLVVQAIQNGIPHQPNASHLVSGYQEVFQFYGALQLMESLVTQVFQRAINPELTTPATQANVLLPREAGKKVVPKNGLH